MPDSRRSCVLQSNGTAARSLSTIIDAQGPKWASFGRSEPQASAALMSALGRKQTLANGGNRWKADTGELARSTVPVLGERQQQEGPMTRSLLLLSALVLLAPACQEAKKPANDAAGANSAASPDTSADEQAIRGEVDRWLELVKAKDAAAIAGLYAEDGAVMPPNAPIGKGREAIQKTWASIMQTPGFDL